MTKEGLNQALINDGTDHPNGPVFVKVIAHNVTMWIEIVGVESPEPQEPPWSAEAPFVLVSRSFAEKGIRATIPRLRKPTLPPVVQDSQDPAESHFGSLDYQNQHGFYDQSEPYDFKSPPYSETFPRLPLAEGRGPEHG